MKQIKRPELPGAHRLTAMEMNNLHFRTLDNHSVLPQRQTSPPDPTP